MFPKPHVIQRGSGTPILFIHGNGVDHRLLLNLDDIFETGRWERIYLDLPGFGKTQALEGQGDLQEMADWLNEAVEVLVGDEPFAVVGNSMGGLLVRDLVAHRQEQCLGFALLAPVVDPVHKNRTLAEFEVLVQAPELVKSLLPADAELYSSMAVIQSKENWELFRETVCPGVRVADDEAMERLGQHYELDQLPDVRLKNFVAPVLIVTGRQDNVVGYQDQWSLAQNFNHASFAVLDAAGHNVHLDQEETVKALLKQWEQKL